MKKTIKLTDSDLEDIIKKVVTESEDPDMSEFRKFVPLLQKINNRIDMKEVITWFNMNDIDYIGMNDLQMIIIYIARNS